ncbi:MAG TPA: tetratricopeptide repeat protein [Candidatus Acidoferrum sp.]|nr:tetratricopeptide repeat protein [Candidatus Acidoferrum sp.]
MARFKSFILFVGLAVGALVISQLHAQQADKVRQTQVQASASPAPASTTVAVSSTAPTVPPPSPLAAATQLFRSGKFSEAESAYNAILQSNTKSTLAYIGLFRTLLLERRQPEAATALAKAIELEPNSDAVRVAQGEMYFRQGRMQDAQGVSLLW